MALFTSLNARSMGIRSGEVRRERATIPDPPIVQTEPERDSFLADAIACTREAFQLVMQRLLEESRKKDADGQRLSWLATAADKIHTQWHNLSGNPKPAPLKMTSRQARQYQAPSTSPPPTATE